MGRSQTEPCEARVNQAFQSAANWLAEAQDRNGGWGGFAGGTPPSRKPLWPSEALISLPGNFHASGEDWLCAQVLDGAWKQLSPIAFRFAKLWCFETLYPRISATSALSRLCSSGRRIQLPRSACLPLSGTDP